MPPAAGDPPGPLAETMPAPERRRSRGRGGRRLAWFLGVAAGWVGLDQITKVAVRESLASGEHWEISGFFRISHITNDGAAFGILQDQNALLAVLTVVTIGVLAAYSLAPSADHWLTRTGLALLLGGAVGNLLDRLYQGEVTDFVNFDHFPAFNVADAGINLGIGALLLYLLLEQRTPRAERSP